MKRIPLKIILKDDFILFYFTFLPLLMLFIEMSDKTEPASKQNFQSFPPSTL